MLSKDGPHPPLLSSVQPSWCRYRFPYKPIRSSRPLSLILLLLRPIEQPRSRLASSSGLLNAGSVWLNSHHDQDTCTITELVGQSRELIVATLQLRLSNCPSPLLVLIDTQRTTRQIFDNRQNKSPIERACKSDKVVYLPTINRRYRRVGRKCPPYGIDQTWRNERAGASPKGTKPGTANKELLSLQNRD